MTKFEQMRHSANMMEHACSTIMDVAYEAVRGDDKYLKQPEDKFDWFDHKELHGISTKRASRSSGWLTM